jgi:hypothetical protein
MMGRNAAVLIGGASLFACSQLVGADFDDRHVGVGTGGVSSAKGGTSALGGQNSGGIVANGGKGMAGGNGGSSVLTSGGTEAGGSAGETTSGGTSGAPSGTGGISIAGAGDAGSGPGGSGGQGGGAGGVAQGGGAGAAGEPGLAGASGEAGAGGAPHGPAVVVLNEVKGQGSGDDYIELYNIGPGTFDLEGYGISDANNTFVFPSGASLPEAGYMLLLLGQTPSGGPFNCFTPNPCFHATWGISQGGEAVYFRGRQNQVLESTDYPNQNGPDALTNEQTWGRFPDGSGAFGATRPTPEARNQAPL